MKISEETFYNLVNKFENIPFEQTKGWQNFQCNNISEFAYFTDNNKDPFIISKGRIFRKRFVGRILEITGEIASPDVSQIQITNYYKSIIEDAKCDLILLNFVSKYAVKNEIALRRSGFNRPMGNRFCPLTIMIDLQDGNRSGDRNWRRNLRKGAQEGLICETVDRPSYSDAEHFCQLFEELREMKRLNYRLEPDKIYNLLQCPEFKLFNLKLEGKTLCSRIVYINNGISADVFAANSKLSRKYAATNFIMEKIFNYLAANGVKTFDFSRIPPSSNETDSVYVFKASSGGYAMQYLGEWIWAKNKFIPLIFCIYNFYIRKAHRY